MRIEILRHKPGMLDRNAKSEALHRLDVGDIFQDGPDNQIGPALGRCPHESIQVGERRFVISAPYPAQLPQINRIGHPKILER